MLHHGGLQYVGAWRQQQYMRFRFYPLRPKVSFGVVVLIGIALIVTALAFAPR